MARAPVGNCLTYAIGMWLAEGFTGRIKPTVLYRWPPKIRFYYIDAAGRKTHFFPKAPRPGWAACWHALWFTGKVKVVAGGCPLAVRSSMRHLPTPSPDRRTASEANPRGANPSQPRRRK